MKKVSFMPLLLCAALNVQAALISVGSGAFSGSETLITFDLVTDEAPIETIGPVTFTNLWGETTAADGTAQNFIGGCLSATCLSVTIDFASTVTTVGWDMLTSAGATHVTAFSSAGSASLSFPTGGSSFFFIGLQDLVNGIDQLVITAPINPTLDSPNNHPLIMNNFRYEDSSVVPIPAAAWLFGSALLGLGAIKRRKA